MMQSMSPSPANELMAFDIPMPDEVPANDPDVMICLDGVPPGCAEAMQQELKEMAEALDEIAQSVIY